MIISNHHQFLYVAIPKTGTHAIREALRMHLHQGDWEQCNLYVTKILPFIEIARKRHGHITTQEIQPFLGDVKFDAYFKFAFVRNPWDKFVSYCSFVHRKSDAFQKNPRAVMGNVLSSEKAKQRVLMWPQHRFITDAEGNINVDFVGRHETFAASFNEICSKLGLPRTLPEKVNTSNRSDYRDYYTQALIDGVGELYQKDIELFNYAFDTEYH